MQMLRQIKSFARGALANALYYSGALHWIKRRRLRGRAVVLMYHRVLSASERLQSFSSDGIQVSPETFERHLRILRRHFHVVSPAEFSKRLLSGEGFTDATCLITFDDGWRDNYLHAFPLLRRYGMPAVIFLPTDYINSDRCFWQETLARLLWRLNDVYRASPSAVADLIEQLKLTELFASDGPVLKQGIHDYVRALKVRPDDEIQRLMQRIEAAVGREKTDHPDRFLTWDEVRDMAQAGVTFGSHAVSHRILTQLSPADVTDELTRSKQEIAARAGIDAELLAYPNGDCNQATADAARHCGYAAAFTTAPGTVSGDDDRFLLRRVNIHDRATRTSAGFYATLLGVL